MATTTARRSAKSTTPAASSRRRAPARGRPKRPLTIDFHSHIVVPEVLKLCFEHSAVARHRRGKMTRQAREALTRMTDTRVRLKDMDGMGLDIQVLTSSLIHHCSYWADGALGLRIERMVNDRIAEMVAEHPDRLVGLATVPLQDVGRAVRELDRAVIKLGLRGVEISSQAGGKELGDKAFRRFWAKAQELDVPVYIHPAGVADPRYRKFGAWNSIGQPLEETLAMFSLITEGVLERFPKLKICVAHGGGFMPFYAGRVDRNYHRLAECRQHVDRSPSRSMRRFYYDTAIYNPDMLDYLAQKVGTRHLLMGTDYPFGETDPVGFVRKARSIPREIQDDILGRNAARMLKLPV